MHKETLAPQTERLWELFCSADITAPATGFYLAGGTSLALQIGHRQSEDLDFFTQSEILPARITEQLQNIGELSVSQEESRTINAVLNDVKVSFLSYPYPLAYPLIELDGRLLADERDIAAMKLSAIAGRGAKKDFFDIFFLLQKYSLREMIGFFETMFIKKQYNQIHLLKSLMYFEDAEHDPDPIMLIPTSWNEVKDSIKNEVSSLEI
jgi:predicted nucleotidyltransferase component of viral defense system